MELISGGEDARPWARTWGPRDNVGIPGPVAKLQQPGLGPRQVFDYGDGRLVPAIEGSAQNRQNRNSGFLISGEWYDSWLQDYYFSRRP